MVQKGWGCQLSKRGSLTRLQKQANDTAYERPSVPPFGRPIVSM